MIQFDLRIFFKLGWFNHHIWKETPFCIPSSWLDPSWNNRWRGQTSGQSACFRETHSTRGAPMGGPCWMCGETISRWWFQIFFMFTPTVTWGRWTQFDEHIFQMGWNHHLDFLFWCSNHQWKMICCTTCRFHEGFWFKWTHEITSDLCRMRNLSGTTRTVNYQPTKPVFVFPPV